MAKFQKGNKMGKNAKGNANPFAGKVPVGGNPVKAKLGKASKRQAPKKVKPMKRGGY
jgi:hypothetical protein